MRLPNLNALRAFEAAARHGGFVGAADELHVTRAAISRHIRLLEADLGVALFQRHARGVALSPAGEALLRDLTPAFRQMQRATDRARADAAELRILCPPATSIRWLIPRLERFRTAHPEIQLRLTTAFYDQGGLEGSGCDIGFSLMNWPGGRGDLERIALFPVELCPAVAPSLLKSRPLRRVEDLARYQLLHETAAHRDWREWQAIFAVPGLDETRGDEFPNLDMAVTAAVVGQGAVMSDRVLCDAELSSGALIRPFPELSLRSALGDVCLVLPAGWRASSTMRLFTEWACDEARRDCLRLGLA